MQTRPLHQAMTTGTTPTVQIQLDKMGIRSYPLQDGAHDPDLDFQDRPSHWGPLTSQTRVKATDTMTSKGNLLPYYHHDASKRIGDDDEGHGKTMSCRIVGESPPCQQCRYDWHCSITIRHAMTWKQDHDDDHTMTCTGARTR